MTQSNSQPSLAPPATPLAYTVPLTAGYVPGEVPSSIGLVPPRLAELSAVLKILFYNFAETR